MNLRFAALLLAILAAPLYAQHEHHHTATQTRVSSPPPAEEHPSLTREQREAAFPDPGGMDMREHMDDDPVIATLLFDQLEWRDDGDLSGTAWKLRGWIGDGEHRVWLRTEGERPAGNTRGDVELLWGRPTGPWWDMLLGVRHDVGAGPRRDWLAMGVKGLAPYKVEVEATAYVGPAGRLAARAEAEYDVLLTNRLVLQPKLEANAWSPDAEAHGDARVDASFGLRLRYELRREFAPYLGYAWSREFGGGANATEGQWVAGMRVWF